MTNGDRLSEVERINREGAADLQELAERTRKLVIDTAYEAVKVHLAAQRQILHELEEAGFPEGAKLGYYVLESYTDAPFKKFYNEYPEGVPKQSTKEGAGEDIETQNTISIVFIPPILGEVQPLLRVHVPVTNDFDLEKSEMPPREEIDEIYLEYVSPDSVQRFVLSEKFMYEYVSASDTGSQDIEDVLGSDEELMANFRRSARRIEDANAIAAAAKVNADLLDGKVVPQRHSRVGDSEVIDIIP